MKYRVTNLSKRTVELPFRAGTIVLAQDESAEVDIAPNDAAAIASPGVVRFTPVANEPDDEPAPLPAPAPAQPEEPEPQPEPPASEEPLDETEHEGDEP